MEYHDLCYAEFGRYKLELALVLNNLTVLMTT